MGERVAACGLVGVTFNHRSTVGWTRIGEAASDIDDLVATVRDRATEYGVDPFQMAIWVCSAGGYLGAGAALNSRSFIRCLVIYYGLMEPVEASAADLEKFSTRLLTAADGPPILVARAGLDRPRLNEALDRFTDAAVKAGREVELHNHPHGRHAFDVLDPGQRSSEIIARTIEFLRLHLLPAAKQGRLD